MTAPEDLDEVRRLVDDVLSRAAFRDAEPSWLDRLLARLGDLFDPLVRRAGEGSLFDVLSWLVVGAVVAFLAVALARGWLQRSRRGPGGVLDEPGQVGRPSVDWAAEARAHAADGEHREAVRCHLRAGVAELAGRGLLREVAGRTVAEYARELERTAPRRTAAFGAAAEVFETVWYAGEPADAGHTAAIAAAVARLDRDERPVVGSRSAAP